MISKHLDLHWKFSILFIMKFFNYFMSLFVLLQILNITRCSGSYPDQLALLDLKKGLLGDGRSSSTDDLELGLSSWNASLHFCQWQGITCDRHQRRVTALKLAGQGLAGTLLPSIGNLTFLRLLDLSENQLKDKLPKEIGLLSRLQIFNMSFNALDGGGLLHFTNCTELRIISLTKNRLVDTIPYQLGFMSKLEKFMIVQNNLTGEIPSSIGNLSSLATFAVSDNRLHGKIPRGLGKLKNLQQLLLGDNNLSGTIPSSFYNLSSIRLLSLVNNHLSGDITPILGGIFPYLQRATLGNNYFTGVIPPTLSNLSDLQLLDIGNNHLSGSVPKDLGRLKNLQSLRIWGNDLGTGKNGDLDFITSLTNLTGLRRIDMSLNSFGGLIPSSIGNLSDSLEILSFGNNNIYGSIPAEVGNLVHLMQLGFEYNNLTGEIPSSIGNLVKLEGLYLGGNRLGGTIPASLGNLTNLIRLGLEDNQLEGGLPPSFRHLSNLLTVSFKGNKFNGSISGEIISSLDQLVIFDISDNLFTGHFPEDIGKLVKLNFFHIANNKFSGEIPAALGKCSMLETVGMLDNMFEGSIPSSLSSLKGLLIMELSYNNLSGKFPTELKDLPLLYSLDISFNNLEGEVPTTGVFSNSSGIFVEGNKKLCGGIPQLGLPRCLNIESRKAKKFMPRMAVVAAAVSVSICFIFAFVLICFLWRKVSRRTTAATSFLQAGSYLCLSYKELFDATDQFSASNLIGVGSFGSVYQGALIEENKLIAVKVLNLMRHGALKSFKAECKVLSNIRHRNLLQILSCCSSLDFRGNDFLALVYELMPNGSLDSWLHGSMVLKFWQRLEIAIQIASALDYLHHHCQPRVVHCDLKPSNVLLDADMVAHVGDFGMAKLLMHGSDTHGTVNKDQTSSVAVKGTVGYVPPEYGMGGNVSTQGDAYSFGILLLEMITGKRPTDEIFRDGSNLHNLCSTSISNSSVLEILDSSLLSELDMAENSGIDKANTAQETQECMNAVAEVGTACSVESPNERLNVEHALKKLQKIKTRFLRRGARVPVSAINSS